MKEMAMIDSGEILETIGLKKLLIEVVSVVIKSAAATVTVLFVLQWMIKEGWVDGLLG